MALLVILYIGLFGQRDEHRQQAAKETLYCRRARSLFALGLQTLRKIFVAASPDQIIAFLDKLLFPKLPVKPLLALAFR